MAHDATRLSPLSSCKSQGLVGRLRVPGDKSISHRALIFGALARGETTISGLLESEDVLNTAAAMSAFGATIRQDEDGIWHVDGLGTGCLLEPTSVLDFGNSGTGARLVMGLAGLMPSRPPSWAMRPCPAVRWRGCSIRCARWACRFCPARATVCR